MDNVIYQVHMYQPGEYTHQGVHCADDNYPKFAYPNAKKGWNRDFIRKRLAPEGAGQYIADCISLFEEYGWDWTYHAFREWPGWSVEHEVDGKRGKYKPSADNPRRRALLEGFAR